MKGITTNFMKIMVDRDLGRARGAGGCVDMAENDRTCDFFVVPEKEMGSALCRYRLPHLILKRSRNFFPISKESGENVAVFRPTS